LPQLAIDVVVNATRHGANRKIANLMNMLPAARHDLLVIADSDLHVRPDYLRNVVATLLMPGCGLVTTACAAEPVSAGLAPRLGVSHMTHGFLPGAMIGAAVGRQDCLGGTMALRRATLAQIGGLPALVNHLADDNVLGRLVNLLGLSVRVAPTMPVVVVQERRLRALWLHELRWARTIGAVAPIAFFGCIVQFPIFWALLALICSAGAPWAITCFLAAWGVRAAVVVGIDRALRENRARPAPRPDLWLLPVRDVLSVAVLLWSFVSDEVVWRGHVMQVDRKPLALPDPVVFPEAPELQT
jgi:ceramide glucosyltransferase